MSSASVEIRCQVQHKLTQNSFLLLSLLVRWYGLYITRLRPKFIFLCDSQLFQVITFGQEIECVKIIHIQMVAVVRVLNHYTYYRCLDNISDLNFVVHSEGDSCAYVWTTVMPRKRHTFKSGASSNKVLITRQLFLSLSLDVPACNTYPRARRII